MGSNQSNGGKRGRTGRRLFFLVAAFVIGLAGYLGFAAVRYALRGNEIVTDGGADHLTVAERLFLQAYLSARVDDLHRPAGSLQADLRLEVPPGASAGQIADRLIAEGALNDRELFLNYVKYYGIDLKLEAGYFQIPAGSTLIETAWILTAARDPFITLTFIEGWRLEEMARAIETNAPGEIDASRFLASATRQAPFDLSPYDFLSSLPPNATLEGYLFPDTYRLPLDATADDLVAAMLDNFGEKVSPNLRQSFGLQNLSLFEGVTLASLVQREAVLDAEKPIIAAVFLNRLQRAMRLEADPTIQYALGYQPETQKWWKSGLTLADLRYDSPYNTYLYPGLMPGPIASPGLAALEGVAYPANTDALFFVVDCTASTPNSHVFSETFEEHLAHVERCR